MRRRGDHIAAAGGTAPLPFRHEAALFDRDDELAAIVAPFLEAGLDRDEPTIVAVGPACAARLEELTPELGRRREDLVVLPESEEMRRPAVRLQTLRRVIDVHLAGGAPRVRLVSALPVDGDAGSALAWQPWARYESLLEVAFADYPLWQLCLFDRRTAGAPALDHALRCHTHLATALDGHLEVTDRPAPGSWVVVAGLGPRSQWYRNVVADPRVLVWVGHRRHVRSTARTLPPDDGARLLDEYASRYARGWAVLEPVLKLSKAG